MGEQFKLARKRISHKLLLVVERAGIHRETLRKVEIGDTSLPLDACLNVHIVMNLENDFLKLAADDELGKKLQDLNLVKK